MKFKYYLKGLGMGIIVTTIIMTVSCVVHNNNLSDQEIIEKAEKLGMVMTESQTESKDDLFGNNGKESESGDDSETESDSEPRSERETNKESEMITLESETEESEVQESVTQDSQTQEPETQEPETQESETQEPETQETETQETETQGPTHIEVTQYILHISWGDTPRMIATELYENGMVDSASSFRKYLADNGYAGKLRSGTYTITKGMSYKEIAQMITKK